MVILRRTTDYEFCGWRVRSELPLPELARWTGNSGAPDIDVRLVSPEAAFAAGGFLLEISDIGCFAVRAGREVLVAPVIDLASPSLRVPLYGTVFGVLCHQRGLLALHAGCVAINGRAVLLAGPGGAGKSSLTAVLLRRGCRFLSEDLCPLSWPVPTGSDPHGPAIVLPSIPRLKLCPDALGHLGWPADPAARLPSDLEKYAWPVPDSARSGPVPVAAIYHLSATATAETTRIEPLSGGSALQAICASIYLWEEPGAFDRPAAFQAAARLATAIPSFRLQRRGGLDDIEAMADTIMAREERVAA